MLKIELAAATSQVEEVFSQGEKSCRGIETTKGKKSNNGCEKNYYPQEEVNVEK